MFDLTKRLGWKPQPPDKRDLRLCAHPLFSKKRESPPARASIKNMMSPVRDQGDMGACTGFALAAMREYYEILDSRSKSSKEVTLDRLSPLFIYNKEREMEGTLGEDRGAYLRSGMKVLQKYGVSTEDDFPFSWDNFSKVPLVSSKTKVHCVYSYLQIREFSEIKKAISMRLPIVCGISVYKNWDLPMVYNHGIIPEPSGSLLGGHAVMMVGYDDDEEMIEFKNSWGTDWGNNGYFRASYDYVENSASDFWVALRWR